MFQFCVSAVGVFIGSTHVGKCHTQNYTYVLYQGQLGTQELSELFFANFYKSVTILLKVCIEQGKSSPLSTFKFLLLALSLLILETGWRDLPFKYKSLLLRTGNGAAWSAVHVVKLTQLTLIHADVRNAPQIPSHSNPALINSFLFPPGWLVFLSFCSKEIEAHGGEWACMNHRMMVGG